MTERTTCRACGGDELTEFLSLGEQALANDFRLPEKNGDVTFETYPLRVVVCEGCCHSQLTHTVDRLEIFAEYPYRSGTTQTLQTFFAQFVNFVETVVPRGRILDIGCNDGSQLLEFQKRGWECVGVDPCAKALAIAKMGGIETYWGFWTDQFADLIAPVDVILAQNVLAHTDDVDAFLRACRTVLRPGGRLIVQTSQARMIDEGQFDMIYHEHLSYFTTHSLRELAERNRWDLEHATTTPIHGISYVWVLARDEDVIDVKPSVDEMLAWEKKRGLFEAKTYTRFREKTEKSIRLFRRTVEEFRRDSIGAPVVGYGAAAKGVVLLQAAGIQLDAIIDECSTKWGTIAPGAVGKVVSPQYMALLPNDREVMWIILAWNFFAEIMSKLTRECGGGDRLVTVFPKFQRMIIRSEDRKLDIVP